MMKDVRVFIAGEENYQEMVREFEVAMAARRLERLFRISFLVAEGEDAYVAVVQGSKMNRPGFELGPEWFDNKIPKRTDNENIDMYAEA